MAQYIKQGSLFGRIGTGAGRGLAEQLPKEIERNRLAAGLKEVGEQTDRSPFQQFSSLASIPGVTPQIIESGANLLRQQGMLKGAKEGPTQDQRAFESIRNNRQTPSQEPTKGLIDTSNTQAALNPAIPKSLQQLQDRAAQLNEQNPGLYPDYQTALQGATQEEQQRIAQNQAQQGARQSQKGVETDLRRELRGLESAANAKVPDNVYQKIENEALEDINSGKKDELTAAKDARDKLDAISRDYSSIDSLGNMTLLFSNPKEVISSITNLRKKFKANNDVENFADALVSRNGLSNEYAHYLASPPPQKIKDAIKDLPSLKGKIEVVPGTGGLMGYKGSKIKDREQKSQDIVKKLAGMLDKNDSPLSISHELEEKGYDSNIWRDYLIEHQDELNLSKSQIRELQKVDKAGQGFMNDWWLKIFGGP